MTPVLGSFLVVFREVLEAALIVGIVLAATDGLPRRNAWILAGLGAGLVGSALIAGFADVIAAFAEGMGQEYFNAGVLFIAVAVLGWSIVWMRRHGREISAHANNMGLKVASGSIPIYMLAVVVGLAVLREGSEAVLFLYGIAAGQEASASKMFVGSFGGVAAGVAVGYLLYRGLVRIAARHLFGVTSWLLAFLAAGMASQAAGLLVAAGALPPIVNTAWNTSAFLSERNILGQVLHTLVGYDSHPALVQVLFYAVTLGTIVVMMRAADRKPAVPRAGAGTIAALVLAGLAFPRPGHAEQKVYSPIVHEGELAIEARGDASVRRGDATEIQNQKYEIEYGVTDRWMTALVAELSQDVGQPLRYETTGWENIIQLFEQGEAWVDSGIYLEYERADAPDAPDEFEGKLLLEKQFGRVVNTANLIFDQQVGAHAHDGTEFGYALRTRYLWKPYLEPAVEAYGDVGEMVNVPPVHQQRHRLGPVILGMIPLVGTVAFRYELGWLFGLSGNAPDHSVKWLAELEVHI